jgi:hypothetical protein
MTMTVRDNILIRLAGLEQKVGGFAEKAAKIFEVLGYKWAYGPALNEYRVPTAAEIRDTVYGLIREVRTAVWNDEKIGKGYNLHFCETGRLKVVATHTEDGEIEVKMTMIALDDDCWTD